MTEITERHREWARAILEAAENVRNFNGLVSWLHAPDTDPCLQAASTKLAELEGDPPQERVVDPEDMVCPQCQKPLTNPDDPCDCPTQDLEDAVREVVRDKFIGVMCDEHHAGDIINIIVAAVKPGYDILRAETATQHRKIGELQADNDTLEKRIERLEKYEAYAAYAGVTAKDGDIPVSFVVWMKQFEEALDE